MGVISATAISHPNIAFIKYWGNRDHRLRLPSNGSISMTLGGMETVTKIAFDPALPSDLASINGQSPAPETQQRISAHLDLVRGLAGISTRARIESASNFPMGVGLASSASAFASLTLAAFSALGLDPDPKKLSQLARRGSGSACRSIFGGYVECLTGDRDEDGYARQLAAPEHWPLKDWIALVSDVPKRIGSSAGHKLADSSPLQPTRLGDAPRRLNVCREAILAKDFERLAQIVELDCNLMHAVMLTSEPPLLYWRAETLRIMREVRRWRGGGLPVCYTVDAGPNVHCLCPEEAAEEVGHRLKALDHSIDLVRVDVGGPARLVES